MADQKTNGTAAALPPTNLEAEESVLGAMMLSGCPIDSVSETLDAGDFYRESHSKIYRAALGLYAAGSPVDPITVVDELEKRGELEDDPRSALTKTRIHELAALVPTRSNVVHYAKIVHEMATLRALIRAGSEIQRYGYDRPGPVEELVERAESAIFDLALARSRTDFVPLADSLVETFERITLLYERGEDVTGVPCGFPDIDRMTSGFQPGNLFVLAARPSMGKSALAFSFAANIAVRQGLPVGVFTLEMSRSEVTQRLMSMESLVDSSRIRNGKLASDDWPRLTRACDLLTRAPVFIDDNGSATMAEVRSKARRLKMRNPNLALVIVDYLQLMTADAENRVQEVSRISRSLKQLAREIDVPVVALSQLSRGVESRHDRRPVLSDLRESGAIEQDADLVVFLYRDEYYNPEDPDVKGLAEVIIAKHRNGPTGTVKLSFRKDFALFSSLARPA
jgi:replicative DNA helicase